MGKEQQAEKQCRGGQQESLSQNKKGFAVLENEEKEEDGKRSQEAHGSKRQGFQKKIADIRHVGCLVFPVEGFRLPVDLYGNQKVLPFSAKIAKRLLHDIFQIGKRNSFFPIVFQRLLYVVFYKFLFIIGGVGVAGDVKGGYEQNKVNREGKDDSKNRISKTQRYFHKTLSAVKINRIVLRYCSINESGKQRNCVEERKGTGWEKS